MEELIRCLEFTILKPGCRLLKLCEASVVEKDEKLTLKQAFYAMFYFIENEYKLTKSDDMGALLGSLDWTIWNDSGPADPAVWDDWIGAVEKAKKSKAS